MAQEALVRAWRARGACSSPDDPLPWLRAIARREAWRHHERQRDMVVERPPEQADVAAAVALDATPLRLDLRRALNQLPPSQAVSVVLRYAGDLTQPAIAERLGVPEGTVKVRLHRARQELSRMLIS